MVTDRNMVRLAARLRRPAHRGLRGRGARSGSGARLGPPRAYGREPDRGPAPGAGRAVPGHRPAANRALDHDFDGQHDAEERGDLAAADADLRAAAATERAFDRQLIALRFPPPAEPFVRLLYRVNQDRAALTATAATAMSLMQLHGVQPRLDAANGPVEEAVQVIRDQLDLPPPDTS